MKKIIALIAALALVLSLSACFMPSSTDESSTSDQADAADVSTYDKNFDGLVQYLIDRNSGCEKQEIFYDIIGADNGVRLILNKNAYIEIYSFAGDEETATADSSWVDSDNLPRAKILDLSDATENSAMADSGESAEDLEEMPTEALSIPDIVREDGKFHPVENGSELTAIVTDSGKYVIAWDATRSYDYEKKVATDELKENW